MSTRTVETIVRRGDSWSRTGLIGLGIFYDEFFEHAVALGLPEFFLAERLSGIAYYCALREAHPRTQSLGFLSGPGDFRYGGLRFDGPEAEAFANTYPNRGPSAILDYLVPDKGNA